MPGPWTCPDCSTTFRLRLLVCPRCRAFPERTDMPKITRNGGASNAAAEPVPVSVEEVGEQPSPGNSSSASPEKPKSSERSRTIQSPAPTTGNRSGRGRKATSSARGTGGAPTARDA